jgi:glycosyltransferase involved in cell wall biosynthesis
MLQSAGARRLSHPVVLVLCDTVAHDGGAESYLSRVLPALGEQGADVRIAARRVLDEAAFGVPAIEIPWAADNKPASRAAGAALRDLIRSVRPDAVITSNIHDAEAMAAARTAPRLIVRLHDHRMFCPQGDRQFPHFRTPCTHAMGTTTCLTHAVLRGCIAGVSTTTVRLVRSRLAVRDAALHADHFIVSSQFMAGLCRINGVPEAKINIFVPPFAGAISRAPRPARDRVFFAGRLVRDKGLELLIRAVAGIPRAKRPELAVAGAMTAEVRALPKLAERLGVALTMLGKIGSVEVRAEIDRSTLVAVPSLWPEPFGLVGVEAQARGRPVAAFDVGAISEWMGTAGILVRRGDVRAMGSAIAQLLEPARWFACSDAAIRQAATYRVEQHAEAILGLVAG